MTSISIIGLSGESIFLDVDEFHKPGETITAKHIHTEPGGKGYNQAIACKRMGCNVSYLTCVGNDIYGKKCEDYMKEEGIKTFFKYKDINTSLATILTNKKGENEVTVYQGSSNYLNNEDLNSFKNEIKKSDVLLLQEEIPYNILKEALKYAHENNVYTILNPAPSIYNIDELLPYIDLLIPNASEAESIFHGDLKKINGKNLIVTLGDKGASIYTNNQEIKIEANKVKVIDTTGAGDVFCAVVASFIKEKGLVESARLANNISSIHIGKKYVMDAIPKYNDIKKFL